MNTSLSGLVIALYRHVHCQTDSSFLRAMATCQGSRSGCFWVRNW
jgi:hypothetical protein